MPYITFQLSSVEKIAHFLCVESFTQMHLKRTQLNVYLLLDRNDYKTEKCALNLAKSHWVEK